MDGMEGKRMTGVSEVVFNRRRSRRRGYIQDDEDQWVDEHDY